MPADTISLCRSLPAGRLLLRCRCGFRLSGLARIVWAAYEHHDCRGCK